MAIPLYIRKEYFRGVTLSDKSAHILEFHYKGENVDVFENGSLIFHLEYYLESKFKADILDFYVTDISQRGKGYGSVCMLEILDQLKKKQVTPDLHQVRPFLKIKYMICRKGSIILYPDRNLKASHSI